MLLMLYFLRSLLSLVLFPFVFIPLCIRYYTLRYQFDDEGVRVSYGLLFRREHIVRYARIQDIHLSRGLLERWLGLGTIEVQTASGSALAEAVLVGIREYDLVRDFLYKKMRGARFGEGEEARAPSEEDGDWIALLAEIRDELRRIRERLG